MALRGCCAAGVQGRPKSLILIVNSVERGNPALSAVSSFEPAAGAKTRCRKCGLGMPEKAKAAFVMGRIWVEAVKMAEITRPERELTSGGCSVVR